jgi:hypothetical protein
MRINIQGPVEQSVLTEEEACRMPFYQPLKR